MTEDEKLESGFRQVEVPPYRAAMARCQNPAKQALIKRVKAGNDYEWDTWSVVIEYGARAQFEDILEFFVNVPSLQDVLPLKSETGQWRWERIEPVPLASRFSLPRQAEVARLLRLHAGSDAMIEVGWILKDAHEQHPSEEIKSTSTVSYLIATGGYYAYIETYTEIDH